MLNQCQDKYESEAMVPKLETNLGTCRYHSSFTCNCITLIGSNCFEERHCYKLVLFPYTQNTVKGKSVLYMFNVKMFLRIGISHNFGDF